MRFPIIKLVIVIFNSLALIDMLHKMIVSCIETRSFIDNHCHMVETILNPFMPSGLFYINSWEQVISNRRDV